MSGPGSVPSLCLLHSLGPSLTTSPIVARASLISYHLCNASILVSSLQKPECLWSEHSGARSRRIKSLIGLGCVVRPFIKETTDNWHYIVGLFFWVDLLSVYPGLRGQEDASHSIPTAKHWAWHNTTVCYKLANIVYFTVSIFMHGHQHLWLLFPPVLSTRHPITHSVIHLFNGQQVSWCLNMSGTQ